MQIALNPFGMLRRYGQKLGPYVLVELLLPGGTLLALLLFLYQRRTPAAAGGAPRFALADAWSVLVIACESLFMRRAILYRRRSIPL